MFNNRVPVSHSAEAFAPFLAAFDHASHAPATFEAFSEFCRTTGGFTKFEWEGFGKAELGTFALGTLVNLTTQLIKQSPAPLAGEIYQTISAAMHHAVAEVLAEHQS